MLWCENQETASSIGSQSFQTAYKGGCHRILTKVIYFGKIQVNHPSASACELTFVVVNQTLYLPELPDCLDELMPTS